jgi:hypothetical protein
MIINYIVNNFYIYFIIIEICRLFYLLSLINIYISIIWLNYGIYFFLTLAGHGEEESFLENFIIILY